MNVPRGSLLFGGFGDSVMQVWRPTGTQIASPGSLPVAGVGAARLGCFDSGRIWNTESKSPFNGSPNFTSYCTFDAQLAAAAGDAAGPLLFSGASNYVDTFYGLVPRSPAHNVLYKINTSGSKVAELDLNFSDFNPYAIGVKMDESCAYVLKRAGTVITKCVFGGANSTFASQPAGINQTGWDANLIVLRDDSVVVGWGGAGGGTVGCITRYSSAGVVLNTYNLSNILHITPGLDDTSFWCMGYNASGGAPRIYEIRVSDGAILHQFDPVDGTFEFDGPFCVLQASGGFGAGSCTGGGAVTILADPPDGIGFEGRSLDPRAMLTIGFDDADRGFAPDAINTPAAKYHGSLITIGSVSRGLSDRTTPYKMADCQIEVDDSDRLLSILEDTPASQHWQNREAKLTLQAKDSLAAGETPLTLGRFIWRQHQSDGLRRSIGLTDVLGSEFSDFNLERMLPDRLVGEDFPAAPDDSKTRVVPIAYGMFPDRDGNAIDTSAVTGVTITPMARPAAPTNFTATLTAGGSFSGYGWTEYYAVAAVVGGVMSDLAYAQVGPTDAANRSALLNWDLYPGASAMLIFSAVRSDFAQFAVIPLGAAVVTYDDQYVLPNQDPGFVYPNSPWFIDWRYDVVWYVEALLSDGTYTPAGMSAALHQWPIDNDYDIINTTVTWDAKAGAVGYRLTRGIQLYGWGFEFDLQVSVSAATLSYQDIGNSHNLITARYTAPVTGGASSTNCVIPLIPIGNITVNGTVYLGGLLCGHAITHVDAIAYSLPPQTGDTTPTKTTYASVGSTEWGVEWFAPGQAGWPNATNYIDVNGNWYTIILKLHNPWPDQVLVSCCALEDVGDSSGDTIDIAARQVFHILQNFWLPPLDQEWRSGSWLTPRTFVDGTPIFNTASIAALERIETDRIGRPYRGQMYLDQAINLRTFLERLFVSFGMRFGQNHHGQVIAVHLDDFVDLSQSITLNDIRDLIGQTSMDRALPELENKIVYDYGYRPAVQGQFLRQAQAQSDVTAIGTETPPTGNRGRVAQGERRAMYYVDDPAAASDVVARDLAFGKYPPRYVTITCTLHAVPGVTASSPATDVGVRLGDIIKVTDYEGIGATGWINRPLWVLDVQTLIGDLDTDPRVQLRCVDVYRLLSSFGVWSDVSVPIWASASASERFNNLFWADASDLMSDGSPAKVWG